MRSGWHDLIVVLDDATSEIYYAQLTEAESTASVMTALRQVIETKGVFCSSYSDRASHFWLTPKAGEAVDRQSVTQLGRALRELAIKIIPADLDRVFSVQTEHTVARDNTVKYNNLSLQIDKQSWRGSMEGCRVTVYQHLDGMITIGFGPHEVGRYAADGIPLKTTCPKTARFEPKRLAASLPIRQRGHLMC